MLVQHLMVFIQIRIWVKPCQSLFQRWSLVHQKQVFARYLKLSVYHDSFKQKSGLSPSQAVTVVQQLSDDDELAELRSENKELR